MSRTSGALRQRTSNCWDRYFAVRLYIELKTVPRGGRRRRRRRRRWWWCGGRWWWWWWRWRKRGRGGAAEIEMPYLEDEKGASGWSAVEVRSRKNLPGNKRGYCLREHQAVPAFRTIPVVSCSRTRDSTFPTRIPSRRSGSWWVSAGRTCAMQVAGLVRSPPWVTLLLFLDDVT